MKKILTVVMTAVLVMSLGFSALAATNKKQSILSEMDAAATELGVQNSVTYKNAYNSVANYEGTITDEQYEAALAEIQAIKDAIASKGVDVVRNDETLMNELIAHVIAAAKAVGVTVVYDGNGAGHVTANTADGQTSGTQGSGSSQGTVSNPIKQTGVDFTQTFVLIAGVAVVFAGCAVFARRKQLFV